MNNKKSKNSSPAGRLLLEDGTEFRGISFGADSPAAGEVVFNTGMTGYPETLSDPSYFGQILVLTFPLIGNYGVPANEVVDFLSRRMESDRIQISGLIVSDYSREFSHWNAASGLGEWLKKYNIPALSGIDTRALTKKLREKGTLLGRIEFGEENGEFFDPNRLNLVQKVSISEPVSYGEGPVKVALLDCGCKHHIIRSFTGRGAQVLRLPWDSDLRKVEYDGLLISNGPGDPKMVRHAIMQVRHAIGRETPVFGVCMGNQLLALAAGANTYKLKYGHRSQNQPVTEAGSGRCLITSQNHGFAVDTRSLPADWEAWFTNLNDGTNEGIRHKSGLFRSVQFHPEAAPGPVDAGYLFDEFLEMIGK